jgi:predicted acylesterase/phospholipase RssA
VPYFFKSSPLLAKDRNGRSVEWNPSGHRWIDGSVEGDLPMQKLSELFNVNHFIVCQVNPHVVPFLPKTTKKSYFRQGCETLFQLSLNEFNLRCNQLRELGKLPQSLHRMQSVVSQRYMGDITIVPNLKIKDYLNIFNNPTKDSMMQASLEGERAAWPSMLIPCLQLHCTMLLFLTQWLIYS